MRALPEVLDAAKEMVAAFDAERRFRGDSDDRLAAEAVTNYACGKLRIALKEAGVVVESAA